MQTKEEGTLEKRSNVLESEFWGMILILLCGYFLLHSILGGTLFSHNAWDSYTIQAMAWRDGRLGLGQDYSHLELAVYKGDWYVSFPPFPSVVMLPLTFIFGYDTPNNLLMIAYAVAIACIAYSCLRKVGTSPLASAFLSIFTVWGCNMLWMSTMGGVWFQAQALNMLLLMWMVHAALHNRRVLAYALVALAVGCRPFSICAAIPLFAYFYLKDKADHPDGKFLTLSLRQFKCFILPLAIAVVYMAFNYARFDNPLEFGHNYLPEFTESEHGQFSFVYLWDNLYNLVIRPVTIASNGKLEFIQFNGFMFYIANPMFLILIIRAVMDIIRKRMDAMRIVLLASMLLSIIFLCMHKTLGGWQFGARYTVDFLPLAFFYLILPGKWEPKTYERVIAAFAMMFNLYGALVVSLSL